MTATAMTLTAAQGTQIALSLAGAAARALPEIGAEVGLASWTEDAIVLPREGFGDGFTDARGRASD